MARLVKEEEYNAKRNDILNIFEPGAFKEWFIALEPEPALE